MKKKIEPATTQTPSVKSPTPKPNAKTEKDSKEAEKKNQQTTDVNKDNKGPYVAKAGFSLEDLLELMKILQPEPKQENKKEDIKKTSPKKSASEEAASEPEMADSSTPPSMKTTNLPAMTSYANQAPTAQTKSSSFVAKPLIAAAGVVVLALAVVGVVAGVGAAIMFEGDASILRGSLQIASTGLNMLAAINPLAFGENKQAEEEQTNRFQI